MSASPATAPSAGSGRTARTSVSYVAVVGLLVTSAVAAGLACWWFVSEQGHTHGTELSAAALGQYVLMWSLMMTAMMLPTVHRTTVLYVTAIRRQSASMWIGRLAALLVGYLLVWSVIGIPVYVLGVFVQRLASTGSLPVVGFTAVLLAASGLFQFSALKERCLHHCQSPLAFVSQYMMRTGWDRDLRAGLAHGLTCLGCCAAMVVVLIAVGTMSLPAMVVLGVIAMIEKTWVHGPRFSRVMGIGMILYAAVILVHPAWAPMPFAVPDHSPVIVQSGDHHH
ncbi:MULTISPECIES: DUF2182 domain-containing protein [unclassified Rhodococcus (in: high G+C Gram-positive bacteria)]|uniref:DUF2182 domain-containing protein n=3 Tax=Rhodococcus TaxID=1827 RepID=UPI0009FAE76E